MNLFTFVESTQSQSFTWPYATESNVLNQEIFIAKYSAIHFERKIPTEGKRRITIAYDDFLNNNKDYISTNPFRSTSDFPSVSDAAPDGLFKRQPTPSISGRKASASIKETISKADVYARYTNAKQIESKAGNLFHNQLIQNIKDKIKNSVCVYFSRQEVYALARHTSASPDLIHALMDNTAKKNCWRRLSKSFFTFVADASVVYPKLLYEIMGRLQNPLYFQSLSEDAKLHGGIHSALAAFPEIQHFVYFSSETAMKSTIQDTFMSSSSLSHLSPIAFSKAAQTHILKIPVKQWKYVSEGQLSLFPVELCGDISFMMLRLWGKKAAALTAECVAAISPKSFKMLKEKQKPPPPPPPLQQQQEAGKEKEKAKAREEEVKNEDLSFKLSYLTPSAFSLLSKDVLSAMGAVFDGVTCLQISLLTSLRVGSGSKSAELQQEKQENTRRNAAGLAVCKGWGGVHFEKISKNCYASIPVPCFLEIPPESFAFISVAMSELPTKLLKVISKEQISFVPAVRFTNFYHFALLGSSFYSRKALHPIVSETEHPCTGITQAQLDAIASNSKCYTEYLFRCHGERKQYQPPIPNGDENLQS